MVTQHWTVIAPMLPRHTHLLRHGREAGVEEEMLDRFPELVDPVFAYEMPGTEKLEPAT